MTVKRFLNPKSMKDYFDIFRFLLVYNMVMTREEAMDTLNEFLYRYQSDGLIDEITEAVTPLVNLFLPEMELGPQESFDTEGVNLPDLSEIEYLEE